MKSKNRLLLGLLLISSGFIMSMKTVAIPDIAIKRPPLLLIHNNSTYPIKLQLKHSGAYSKAIHDSSSQITNRLEKQQYMLWQQSKPNWMKEYANWAKNLLTNYTGSVKNLLTLDQYGETEALQSREVGLVGYLESVTDIKIRRSGPGTGYGLYRYTNVDLYNLIENVLYTYNYLYGPFRDGILIINDPKGIGYYYQEFEVQWNATDKFKIQEDFFIP